MSPSARGAGPRPYPRRALALAWLALGLLWFLPLDVPPLFNPDEGRYAEISREMLASGDWVTPRLDGLKYFEKPPLQYWATAVAFEVAGPRAWTARLWSALCGFLGLAVSFAVGRRLYGERAALFSVIVQAGALLYFGISRLDTLDMGLCLTLQLAMSALALLVHRPPPRAAPIASAPLEAAAAADPPTRLDWRPLWLALGVALAMLSKGLIGILIPGAVGLIFMFLYRDARLLRSSRPEWTLAALVLIAAPWFVVVSLRNPGFARFFFIFEHFQRFVSVAGFDRYHPAWFFVPVLAAGLMPWLSLLPGTLFETLRAARREPGTGLLLIWAVFVYTFFTASQSKLVPYILPMMPALSLLMGRALARLPARRLAAHLAAVAALAAVLAAAMLTLWLAPQGSRLVARASTASIAWFLTALVLMGLAAALGARWCLRGRTLPGAASAALGSLLLGQCAMLGIAQLPRMQASIQLARQLQPWIGNYRQFYCVNLYLQTLPFYLQRTCTPVSFRGELDFGLREQPWRGIADLPQFAAVWRRQQSALALLRPADYQHLVGLGVPMHVIYTAPSYVAVVRQ